jgi:pyrroline-5-carboxylate reductase
MTLSDLRIAVIGSGVMGEALISGLVQRAGLRPDQIVAAHPRAERRAELRQRYGIETCETNAEALPGADVLLIGLKPQQLAVLRPLQGQLKAQALVISTVAGTTIGSLAELTGAEAVVRSMPNTPGRIGAGITVWTCAPQLSDPQRALAAIVLGAMGREVYVADEHYLDMATALSGTGPAYIYLVMEAMVDAGVHMGLTRATAEELVTHTMLGSVQFALQSHRHPAQLRNDVTSSGGTTAAALYELEKGGLRTVLSDAIWAAYRRSQELGKRK